MKIDSLHIVARRRRDPKVNRLACKRLPTSRDAIPKRGFVKHFPAGTITAFWQGWQIGVLAAGRATGKPVARQYLLPEDRRGCCPSRLQCPAGTRVLPVKRKLAPYQ